MHNQNRTVTMIVRVVVFFSLLGDSSADPGPQHISDTKKVCHVTAGEDFSNNVKIKQANCSIDGGVKFLDHGFFDGELEFWAELDISITEKMNDVYKCTVQVEGYKKCEYDCINFDNETNTLGGAPTKQFETPKQRCDLTPLEKDGEMKVYYMGPPRGPRSSRSGTNSTVPDGRESSRSRRGIARRSGSARAPSPGHSMSTLTTSLVETTWSWSPARERR